MIDIPKVFCIVISFDRFLDYSRRVYELCTDQKKDSGFKEITRKEAMDIIDKYGLVKVIDNRNGQIYDTPDRDFYKKFNVEIQDDELDSLRRVLTMIL